MKLKCRPSCSTTMPVVLAALLAFTPLNAMGSGYVTVGSQGAQGGAQVTIPPISFVTLKLEARRSYACSLIGADDDGGMVVTASGPTGSNPDLITQCGAVTPIVASDTATDTSVADNRLCVIADVTGDYVFGAGTTASGGEKGRFECAETTLYGGYNTNANEYNFLEIINTSNTKISGFITAVNYDGTTVIDNRPFEVEPNNRVDVDVHTAAGAEKFGAIRVTHTGPYGSLQASLSQYTGSAGGLQLSTSVPLKPREQSL